MRTATCSLLCFLFIVVDSPSWSSRVDPDLDTALEARRIAGELAPGHEVVEIEYVCQRSGPLKMEVFSPAFTSWIRVVVDEAPGVSSLAGGDVALSPLEPAVTRIAAIEGARYRIEIRTLSEPWGGPFEVVLQELDLEAEPTPRGWAGRAKQLKQHAEFSGEPLLVARAELASFLPGVVEEASVAELMRQFPGNQLLGLWDPRWQSLRFQYELDQRFRDEEKLAKEAIQALWSKLGSNHPVVASTQLRLANGLWRTGAVMEAGELIDTALRLLASTEEHPLFAEAELAKGRWLRKTGLLQESRPFLESARAGLEASVGERSLAVSYALEELGALEWDRGDFEAAEVVLGLALEIREETVGTSDLRLVSVLKRLGIAQIAQLVTTPADAVETSDLDLTPKAKKKAKKQAKKQAEKEAKKRKKSQHPQYIPTVATTQPVFVRIAELTEGSRQTVSRLDRAWALSVLASTSGDRYWIEELAAEGRWAKTQLSLSGSYPPMKRRADHVSSWSPALYLDAQKTYERAAAESLSTDVARDRAQSLLRGGELNTSKELLERVAKASEEELGEQHLESALATAELATLLRRSGGNPPEIADMMQRSLEAIRSLLGEDAIPASLLLTDLAALKAEMGLYEEAARLAFEARSRLEAQLASHSAIRSRYFSRLAWTFREAGMIEEMEATLLAAPADSSLTLCTALHLNRNLMLADLRVREGDLSAARALVKAEVDRCGSQGALGKNLAPLKDILDEDYEAREGRRKAKGLDDLHNKGKKRRKKLLIWGGIFVIAAPLALAAASVAVAGAGLGAAGGAAGGSGLASLILLEGMALTAAASPFMMAKGAADPNYKLAPVVDPIRESDYYEVVGAVLQDSGYYSEAAALHRGAIKGMEKGAAKGHPRLAGLYTDLGEVLWDSSGRKDGEVAKTDQKLAREAAEESAEILDGFLHEALSVLPEQQALKLVSSRPRPESILFSGVVHASGPKDPWLRAAWTWTLRKRSLVLDELAFRHQEALESQSPTTAKAWEDFVRARKRVAALWVRGPQTGYTHWPELKDALQARKKAEKALAAASTGFRSSAAYREVGTQEIAKALPRRAALVEFVRVPVRPPGPTEYSDHYVALILDREGGSRFADLGSAIEIDSLVQAWLEELRDSYEAQGESQPNLLLDDTSGVDLRRRVWDPVVQQLQEVDLLFMVLDGSLNQVQFSGLPGTDVGYVIDQKPGIHTLSSGRDLVRIQAETRTAAKGMLALGNPDFDLAEISSTATDDVKTTVYRGPQARCGALREHRWQALPETEIEVEEIAALYEEREEVTLYTRASATEDHLKRMAPGKRYLHIATHGFFLQDECPSASSTDRGIGRLVPATQQGDEENYAAEHPSTQAFGDNPLLLSGLVLAGANNAGQTSPETEDGIATAEELAALDLRGLEIAALSACDTGRGTVATGEGVFGLRRALEIAGARTVLMSLWPVPDEAGRKWMTRFYERKFAGESVQQATWETSLELLHELRRQGKPTHQYLWAGFVAAGDWR